MRICLHISVCGFKLRKISLEELTTARFDIEKEKHWKMEGKCGWGYISFVLTKRQFFEMHKLNPQLLEITKKDLKQLRAERDNATVRSSPETLRKAAQGSENLMPFLQNAVRNYATIGEITKVLKDVFGEYKPEAIAI